MKMILGDTIENMMPDFITVRTTKLDGKSSKLWKLIKDCEERIKYLEGKIEWGELQKDIYNKYKNKKEQVKELIKNYAGRYKSYFDKKIQAIEEIENGIFSYDKHVSPGF